MKETNGRSELLKTNHQAFSTLVPETYQACKGSEKQQPYSQRKFDQHTMHMLSQEAFSVFFVQQLVKITRSLHGFPQEPLKVLKITAAAFLCWGMAGQQALRRLHKGKNNCNQNLSNHSKCRNHHHWQMVLFTGMQNDFSKRYSVIISSSNLRAIVCMHLPSFAIIHHHYPS